jgi:hypothetical protein
MCCWKTSVNRSEHDCQEPVIPVELSWLLVLEVLFLCFHIYFVGSRHRDKVRGI